MSSLRILVLGGTRFVGRHVADAFIAAGDSVTLFNRGVSDPVPRPDVENVRGDRAADLDALGGRTWDAVIDMCGYTPDVVRTAVRYFTPRARQYVFISSISVYDFERAHSERVDEDAPLLRLPAGADSTAFNVEHYGALKSLCEAEVREAFGDRAAILRPGLIAGPHDATDRFTYWPVRVAAGGEMIAPPSDRDIQYADARDAAQFAARLAHDQTGGIYNVVVPPETYTFDDLIAECERATGVRPKTRWMDETFLSEHGVEPWSELPLWIPKGDSSAALLRAGSDRARARGLQCRPLAETVRDTFAWASTARKLGELKAGLSRAREQELLEAANA